MHTYTKICSISLLTLLCAPGAPALLSAADASPGQSTGVQTSSVTPVLEDVALHGKILETMNASGYTYLHLDSQLGKVWVAIPETKVAVGDEVSSAPGMVMRNFTSTTLNRSFESIVFSPGLGAVLAEQPGKRLSPKIHASTPGSFSEALEAEGSGATSRPAGADGQVLGQSTSSGSAGAVMPSVSVAVDKAPGSDSYSVGEVFDQAKALDGKTVRVRGKVVKNSRMIMGKNWLHLQDGTGDPAKNQHDLVVTTQDDPAEGDIVIVQGVVASQRDFGSGYVYQVLIENAKLEGQ